MTLGIFLKTQNKKYSLKLNNETAYFSISKIYYSKRRDWNDNQHKLVMNLEIGDTEFTLMIIGAQHQQRQNVVGDLR